MMSKIPTATHTPTMAAKVLRSPAGDERFSHVSCLSSSAQTVRSDELLSVSDKQHTLG